MSERRSIDQDETGSEQPTQPVQLRLLTGPEARWQLDERTRAAGRKGVAEAREILRRSQPPLPDGRRRAS